MIKIALLGIVASLVSIFFKGIKNEYSLYIGVATCVIIIAFVVSKLAFIVEYIERYFDYISIDKKYLELLMKILGISYIADFSSQICKDSGCNSIAGQIEIAAKIIIISMSIPLLCDVMEMINV